METTLERFRLFHLLQALFAYSFDSKQVRVQPPTSAINVTLLAFAAERRAAAPLLLDARRCRSISPAHRTHSSKPAARCGCGARCDRHRDTAMLAVSKDSSD